MVGWVTVKCGFSYPEGFGPTSVTPGKAYYTKHEIIMSLCKR